MLSRERFELQVGVVFVVTLFLLLIGVLWAKKFNPAPPAMTISVQLPSVGGLTVGDDVFVNGVRFGRVKSIELRPRDVVASIQLDRPIQLFEGYSVHIAMRDITGGMAVNITPGDGEPFEPPYGVLRGDTFDISRIVEPAIGAMSSIAALTDTLLAVLPPIARNIENSLDRLDTVLATAGSDVTNARESLDRTLTDVRGAIASTRDVLSTVQSRFDTTAGHADVMLRSIAATSDSLRRVVAMVDTSSGTFRMLLNDSTLYERITTATASIDSAASNLDSLAVDVRRNPRRYIKFSLF